MTGSLVSALAYIGIGATDLDAWESFATDVLGMQVTRAEDPAGVETLFLRMDDRTHRIAVRAGDDTLSYIGWEVARPEDLDTVVIALTAAGVAVKEDSALAELRGVERLVRFQDPAGFELELCAGVRTTAARFVSPTDARFVTVDPQGRDLGLGHIVLVAPGDAGMVEFYTDVLGFAISDYIRFPGILLTFTHVNPRHHSLAFGPGPDGVKPYLDHVMVEVDDVDTVGRALDVVRDRGMSLTATLGRHTNDRMLSFYVTSPSGIGVEYGTSGALIDDETWTVTTWDAAQTWGHDRNHAH
ncbi:VOC family protein [Nocardioides sp. QY071]|uniref:VOC family protein n=1 Tax=Nocardioides sp. QY071 TaxID=3044187 RepID=UPI00249C0F43|nr:VOC family protein [Nocardioides sp. QY071]WGY00406.1 VOC family protein [Nocardioides sp. QY071]